VREKPAQVVIVEQLEKAMREERPLLLVPRQAEQATLR